MSPSRPLHGLAGRLGLTAASVLACLVIGEIAMRFVLPSDVLPAATTRLEKARLYGWAPAPGEVLSSVEPDLGVRLSRVANSQGWRDVEHTLAKAPGRLRILFVGDSFTYGSVPLEQVYTRRVEAELHARGDLAVEVISMGVGGWGPDQELEALRNEGVRYSPDIVVYQFCTNDVINLDPPPEVRGDLSLGLHKPFRYVLEQGRLVRIDRDSAREVRYEEPYGALRRFLDHSALFRSVAALVPDDIVTAPDPRTDRITSSSVVARFGIVESEKPWWRAGWSLLEALVRQMRIVALSRGARLVVFSEAGEPGLRNHLLANGQLSTDERGDYVDVQGRRLDVDLQLPARLLSAACARQGVPLISPRRTYARFRHDWHPNAAGNESMAEDIVDFLAGWPEYQELLGHAASRAARNPGPAGGRAAEAGTDSPLG